MPLRRKTECDNEDNTYFITTTVMNFDNIFSLGREYNLIVINALKYLLIEHKASLFSYVIMPNHLHLVLYVPKGESIEDFMRDFKKYTSVEIRKLAERENVVSLIERLKRNAEFSKNQKYKVWMDGYDDLIIVTEKMMGIKINYIHNNPVKAGLVENPEDWEFSSARNYLLDDHSIITVQTDWNIN
jgi:REP element-mobilizing transposase RayT